MKTVISLKRAKGPLWYEDRAASMRFGLEPPDAAGLLMVSQGWRYSFALEIAVDDGCGLSVSKKAYNNASFAIGDLAAQAALGSSEWISTKQKLNSLFWRSPCPNSSGHPGLMAMWIM
ncbi:MAG: hypothetical protein M3O00_00570 [Pseudomonadota bacterium]|jgi:hypothetical protein|nr:hypothetical protein [Pseudomonadota bacterium]